MANLRIVQVQIVDSTNINVTFTENLTSNLSVTNVDITADTPNVPSSQVLEIKIYQNTLSIVCQPLTPQASYFISFQSTKSQPFTSLNGDAIILEDGVSNRYLITGPLDSTNPVLTYLQSYFKDNIYNIEDSNTIVSKYINSLATNLARALYDIRQLKNENYLSFTVTDEQQTRGPGPFDRLNEEGAYEIIRVGRTPTNAPTKSILSYNDFPSFPVTLQQQTFSETLLVDSLDNPGKFNINTLTLNLDNSPVTQVTSIVFTFATANPIYTYNITTLGYQIENSRYDQNFASTYLQLANNQVKINEQVLTDPKFSLDNILKIDVVYQYKNLGIVIDNPSLNVYTILPSTREILPPIINIFNLKHAPIVDSNNNVYTLGGITFLDPNSTIPGALHPAFITEIPFRLNALPSIPGQYSIDYTSGTIYVYGSDLSNDGTGPYPPLATYNYRFTYSSKIDYVYDNDLLDLVALPLGSLINFPGTVSFLYEQVLIPGTDYNAPLHQEVLSERIENNLLALNAIRPQKSPITNVFQIYNETSGEIYTLDRWNDNTIYFKYNIPPNIVSNVGERATFNTVINELMFVNTTLTNINSLRIFKIYLNNNTIIASTEDGLAFFTNTSLSPSNSDIFQKEKWFNRELDEVINISNLKNVNEYMVDYTNGIIYCAVSPTQNFDIGTVTYKNNEIMPEFPHLISVDDIYYRISLITPKNKNFSYNSFSDGIIMPEGLDSADELFLNNVTDAPYQLLNKSVGTFFNSSFVPGVTSQIKFIRSVFEYNDLTNSTSPINFSQSSLSNNFNITVNPIIKQVFETVQFDGINYFIIINENIPYLSPNISFNFVINRVSDGYSLWNGSGTIIPGNPIKLILPDINSPAIGDLVNVNYSFTIIDLSRLVIDYNKGDLFIDYTYLADEIIISYEYGDNVLDFRENTTLSIDDAYFVSYKVGALRDALLNNFATLINIPELTNFNLDFDRERYRDCITAALSSFIQGPTVGAIKNIGKTISHVEPQVIESAFQSWSLGSSLLNPESIITTGEFSLLPAKFGNGPLMNQPNQTITFPVNSNIRLEEGTFETWIIPQWNGLDNDSILTFNIMQDGYTADPTNVFIGSSEYHPTISSDGTFVLNKNLNVSGLPNRNKDGIFIYYNQDISGHFSRWYMEIIDGYVSANTSNYKIKVISNGSFYDVKTVKPKPSNISTFTGTNSLNITINSVPNPIDEVLTFLSDNDHYILDFGKDKSQSRLSIYKDISGYFNFRVFDKNKISYMISSDISSWKANSLHHIAASWRLNNINGRDEMHLFVDGVEVPSIIKYGQKLQPYLHEKFRTVDPEELAGLSNRDIVASIDLSTTVGSNIVSSSLNFSTYNIFVGDVIFIDEIGFSSNGYIIENINGQNLTLNSVMPTTLNNDGRFSVNRASFAVTSEIDIVPNIAVSTIHTFLSGNDMSTSVASSMVTSIGTNFSVQKVLPGYMIRIVSPNLKITYTILQVLGNSLIINDALPVALTNATFYIYSTTENEIPGVRALRPSYSISKDGYFNNILTVSNNVFSNDLILIRTLGLNFRHTQQQYYVWSNNQENILKTMLPPPISLDEANITKIILPNTIIGPSNSILSAGIFISNNLPVAQPSIAQNGRSISVTIAGMNVDFSTPVQVTISGVITPSFSPATETITFTNYGTQDFSNKYYSTNYIKVVAKPLNINKNALSITAKEKYSITHSESSGLVPVVRFSYHIGGGYNLYSDGYSDGYAYVRDDNNLFSGLDVGNYLLIHSPITVAGYYQIIGISSDLHTLNIKPTATSFQLPLNSFVNGIYQILNVSEYRSGLQNGYFTLESALMPSQPYFLSQGFYELDYSTYANIKFDPQNSYVYLGSDFLGHQQADAIINQVKIYSTMLTDVRVGESVPNNQDAITKDFNSLKPLTVNSSTLMLLSLNDFPFTNSAKFYINSNTVKRYFQASFSVNDNFNSSLVILNEPIIVSNDGILNTKKEGTIEFWTSPIYDSANDPNNRFYFDAYGAVIENAVSTNETSVKISAPIGQVLSVKLQGGDPKIDYFVGGKLEIDTQNAIVEESISATNGSVSVSKPILQVITVKIAGDLTGTDYFTNGAISTDRKTIYLGVLLPSNNLTLIVTYQTTENNFNQTFNTQVIRLNKKLPYQKSNVIVTYIPKGLQGDRISIYKDTVGYMNFSISASGTDYVVRAPTRWARNTWHRVKASYKINSGIGTDEMRLFIDGYEFTNVTFGSGLVFGKFPIIMGSATAGDGYSTVVPPMVNINFKDSINELHIGTEYSGISPIFALIDNFRISNISRPIYAPYGEPLDVNYSSNLSTVFPVTNDLYTTYLMDFDKLITLNTNFTTIENRETGSFEFSVNIFDSFGIVNSSLQVKEVLEKLINILKPATSQVYIQYID